MMSKSSTSILAKRVSSKKGLTIAEAERFITKMFDVAKDAIQEDKQLKVKWLGTFKVTMVKDRESVDVNTGERIVIEGRDKISFTPDNILKEIVNKPFAQFETVVVNDGVDFTDIDEKFARMENGEDMDEREILPISDVDESFQEQEEYLQNNIKTEEDLGKDEDSNQNSSQEDDSPKSEDDSQKSEGDSPKSEADSPKSEVEIPSELPAKPLVENSESVQSPEAFVENEMVQNENVEAMEQVAKLASEQEPKQVSEQEPKLASEQEPKQVSEQEPELVLEQELSRNNHHFVIPRYLVAIAAVVFVLLFGATFWFAFNYGKMQAQRDSLATQLTIAKKQNAVKKAVPKSAPPKVETDSTQLVMREKARQDSIRMVQSSNAIKAAEESGKTETSQASQISQASQTSQVSQASLASHSYDKDVRVRTGAYRIVGVAQVITVKSGQTLNSLSKRYLGEGMECYIEALNGCKVIKEGQKIKIPKLELKRKKK